MEVEDEYKVEDYNDQLGNNALPQTKNKKLYSVSLAESRFKNDLREYRNKKLSTSIYKVNISKYTVENDEVIVFANFETYFILKFIFPQDYPFSPPSITFVSGERYHLFDKEDNLKLDCLKLDKWSAVLSLNTLLFSIELLLIDIDKNTFYGARNVKKRKFREYEEINKQFIKEEMDLCSRLHHLNVTY